MIMKPVLQNVLVKPLESKSISDGGIYIPDTCKKPSNKVEIIEVGSGSPKKPMRLKRGDIGFRVKDWGQALTIDGELYFIMDQSAIIALQ